MKSACNNPRVCVTATLIRSVKNMVISRVLDLGTGDGSIVKEVITMLNINCEIYGVDIDERALSLAREKGIKVVKADLNVDKLSFLDDYFDLGLMEEVIEHLVNPDNALEEASRVLRRGGLFIITTPNLGWWVNRVVLLLGFQPYWTECSTRYNVGKLFRPLREPLSGHLRLYTLPALRQLLELYNFKILKCQGLTYSNTPTLINIIDKLLSRRASLAQIIACIAVNTK